MKIGPHIRHGYNGPLGKPPVVKLLFPDVGAGEVEYVRQIREQVGWRAWIIARWWQDQSFVGKSDPLSEAYRWFMERCAVMLACAETHWRVRFEGLNEVADSDAGWYVKFERERLRLMHENGLFACVGNWSVGTPDFKTWATYAPLLRAMLSYDLIGLHEYWSDHEDVAGAHGKYTGNPYHVGRWRLVPALQGERIVVTECGRDVVEGKGQAGWQKTCSAEEFIEDLRAYNRILEAYPNVLGATVFTLGDTSGGWDAFECNEIWGRVVEEL